MTINDAPFYYKLVNDPDWLRFIGDRNVNSIVDSEDYITSKIISNYATTKLKIDPIVTITDLENIKSIQLLNRLGLHFDKIIQLPNFDKSYKLYTTKNALKKVKV